jgi:hypothetical protein
MAPSIGLDPLVIALVLVVTRSGATLSTAFQLACNSAASSSPG